MLVLYYTHTILFWLGLVSFNLSEGLLKQLHQYDLEHLPIEVCIARCLGSLNEASMFSRPFANQPAEETKSVKRPLELCIDYCSKQNSDYQQTNETVKQAYDNYSLNLICRDESSLNFKINLHTSPSNEKKQWRTNSPDVTANSSSVSSTAPPAEVPSASSSKLLTSDAKDTVVFVIIMHSSNISDKVFVYLSDENFFTIDGLTPNCTFNISALAVHSSNTYSVIASQQQYQTLRRGYTPGNVTDIKVSDFVEDTVNRTHLSAVLTWRPPPDLTCHYDIICFSPESADYDVQPLEIRDPRELFKYQLENLTFSSEYQVGIRARNSKNMKESALSWKTFRAPSCLEWHNHNFNICAPETPQNLSVEQAMIDRNIYTLNITWDAPTYQPDSYTLYTTDLSPLGKRQKFNVSRDMHSFFIDGIEIYGLWFEVRLTATTLGGSSTAAVTEVTSTISHIPEKNPLVKVIAAVVAPIFCVVILSMTIFMIYHRKAKLKRYQERCKYFEELEKKAPTDPKDNFDFMHTFNVNDKKPPTDILNMSLDSQLHENTALFNDEMEINRSQLTLYEVLGEGAFGLVKRGIYKDSKMSTSYEVAVKMLKDHPSGDEIRAFRREIEVMKSVEKHPNIVGIIGHCTRSSNAMMLLTEYCRFGNLLDFLRDEWRFLHELQRRRPLFGLTTLEVELPYIAGKRLQKLSAFNLFIEDELPSPPPPPTPPSSPPPPAAPSSISWASEETNSLQNIPPKKSNQVHKSMVKELIFEKANISQNVIEKFKRKYNELNKNGQNNGMQQSIENIGSMSMAMALCTTSSSKELKMLQGLAQQQNAFSSELGSPAAENKSYGYEGCCTNSCKCNVDVIITNIDATESRSREQEELSRLLAQQEEVEQQEPRVYSPNKGKLSNNTIIAIKNCDCRHQLTAQSPHKPQRPTLRCHASADKHSSGPHENIPHKGAVENTTYFKLFNSTSSSSTKNLKSLPVGKASKSPSPTPLGPRLAEDDDTWQTTRIPLTAGDLLDIARQVAVGMDFLAKNKVVHRDLAARNVLVAPDRTVKIADFGLSRDIYQENIYKKTGNGKLPIKWLALESLTHQVYTTQSDVWSYGILLYEIVTLGATPYPSIPTNRLLHLLKTGYRMEKPKNCGQEFYDLMNSCWYSAPSERPTFNEIIGKLNEMLLELQKSEQPSQYPLQLDATAQETHARKNDETDDASKQDSPMQQLCTDDSYLKPL